MDTIDWLEARRLHLGLTNDAFAKMLGWSPAKWSRLQGRKQAFGKSHLGEVVAVFDSECAEIIRLFNRDDRAA